MDKVVVAFAVSDEIIAVVIPAEIIRRNFIDMSVALKLHFSVRRNFVILESNTLSGFYGGYDFIDIIAHFFVECKCAGKILGRKSEEAPNVDFCPKNAYNKLE